MQKNILLSSRAIFIIIIIYCLLPVILRQKKHFYACLYINKETNKTKYVKDIKKGLQQTKL